MFDLNEQRKEQKQINYINNEKTYFRALELPNKTKTKSVRKDRRVVVEILSLKSHGFAMVVLVKAMVSKYPIKRVSLYP